MNCLQKAGDGSLSLPVFLQAICAAEQMLWESEYSNLVSDWLFLDTFLVNVQAHVSHLIKVELGLYNCFHLDLTE